MAGGDREPRSINLCDFVSGDQVNLVITNSGLIAAEGLQLVIDQSNPDWSIVPLSTNLGNLEAESSIVVPVILTQVGTATDASVPSSISAVVNWYVAALNTTEYNTTPIFIYNANPLNCNPAVGSSTPVTPTVTYPTNGTGPAEPYFDGSVPAPGSGSSQQPVIAQPSYNFPPPATGAIVNVTLQIDQSAVISQNAFHATLNLDNGSGAQVTDLQVTLNPVDANGSPAPNAFFIQPPVLSGVNAVDGTGSLGIGATAQANWTIIPTTNAAPLGSTIYAIGGSISYMLNGEQVTIPLFAVPITVLPEPQLYLDYFLQHDVYSQDPFANVIEPPEPFALGLRVRNLGLGEANGFTITSAQPTIINNANGLLINFQLIDSQVGANTTPVPSLTLDMGDIDPGTNVVGVWWMTASLEGDFTNFQATFQHSDALGGLETSLISSVVIHEMNHVVRITCPSDDGIPDFLCNDTTNVDALPDDVYSSDGNVYPVTSLTGAVAGGVVSSFGSSVTVNDVADIIPGGFVYFQLPDPSGGTLAITSVTRSDGTQLLVGPNVWQTPYRPHMVPPQLANLVHIFDCESTGSYIINYGSTDTVTWATPAPITYGTPLSSIQLDATASVPGSFVYDPPVGTVLTKGTQTLSVIFTPTDTADYGTITQSVSLSVLPASLTITANTNLAKTYGQTKTFAGTEFTATGLVNGDTVTSVTLTSAGSPPTATVPGSPYPVVPGAAVGTGLTNYIITYMDGALNVIPAGLIVTANSVSRALGSSNPTFTGSIVGLQNGDNITASYATTATVNSPAGPYPIVPTLIDPNGKLPNYSVTTNNGTLTVTPGSLSLLCPANITTNYNFAECGQLVAFAPVAAGVPAPVVTCSFNGGVIHSPFVFPVGTNLVSCTASNAAGVDQCCFRVIVIDTNPPVAGPNTLGTYENTVTSEAVAKVLARDSAPSKGPLSIISVTSPTPNGATVTLGHSLITYMPATSFIGLDTLTYTLSDGCGTAPGTILVTTLATNLPTHNVESITVSTAGRTVVFAGVPKANYEIESASFPTGPWSVLSGVITAAANGLVQYTDTTSPVPPVRFYRIKYISGP